nr:MAG TPA: hypothetical protein [Bacteriophage sp.]
MFSTTVLFFYICRVKEKHCIIVKNEGVSEKILRDCLEVKRKCCTFANEK